MSKKTLLFLAGATIGLGCGAFGAGLRSEYRLLATNKTSTMQKEMDAAAAAGFRYRTVMGGETSFGGSEVVVVMSKDPEEAVSLSLFFGYQWIDPHFVPNYCSLLSRNRRENKSPSLRTNLSP